MLRCEVVAKGAAWRDDGFVFGVGMSEVDEAWKSESEVGAVE